MGRGWSRCRAVVLNFEIREIGERVRAMPGRSAEEWFATHWNVRAIVEICRKRLAPTNERCRLIREIRSADQLRNNHYEQGISRKRRIFERAVDSDPQSSLAHANLGSVLEEVGRLEEAREHLRLAVRFDPSYSDARSI